MSNKGTQPTDVDVVISDENTEFDAGMNSDVTPEQQAEAYWLGLASSNFTTARAYQDSSLINQWERNADHFNSNHYRRSAYNSKLYAGRSKLFRPLTRSSERSASAKAAAAFFTNMDLIDVQPENQNDPEQMLAARVMKKVLHYRLRKSIPWFMTVMGAFQDTRVYGPCCTYTRWEFAEESVKNQEEVLDLYGNVIPNRTEEVEDTVVLIDKPVVDMIPVENLLLDAACDWRDPINSSAYIVRLVPMYVVDVQSKMGVLNTKTGEPEWRQLSTDQIMSASKDTYNTVRQARDGDNREDPTDAQEYSEFKIVWAHENFVRLNGKEYVYWTLGTQYLLTDPTPLEDVYPGGIRPLAYGCSVIEAHRFAPSSATELISNIQASVNDIANLRIDNIRLALNKRYIIRRGAVVDLEALMRSVPGGGIMTENIETDIKVIETKDVTSSSYREQERMETEANDISGAFMGGSVQNNQAMNESVGGMKMSQESSNSISEMDIKTFSETWVQSQLNILMIYIQAFESDAVILKTAFDDSVQNFEFLDGIEYADTADLERKIINRALKDNMELVINVGLGATSPERKAQQLNATLSSVAQVEEQMAGIDWDEVTKEQFAIAGYQDGGRFLKQEDPNEQPELTEEDLEQARQQGMQEAGMEMKRMELEQKAMLAEKDGQLKLQIAQMNAEKEIVIHQQGVSLKEKLDMMKMQSSERQTAMREGNKANEIAVKQQTGSGTTGTGV